MSSTIFQVCFILLYSLKSVIAKECRYIYGNGDIKYFHCNLYEYCCGTMCCRSPAMTFYQMWYFWLMVFLTILFCSGGGWCYKIRNHDRFITTAPRVMPPQMASYYGTGQNPGPQPAAYPQTYPQANIYPQSAYPQTVVYTQTAPYVQNAPFCPPPPYSGPPPSYDTVVHPPQQPPRQ